jgi:hypothetical protein
VNQLGVVASKEADDVPPTTSITFPVDLPAIALSISVDLYRTLGRRHELISADLAGGERVHVAPNPSFPGFDRPHERMLGMTKMLGRVLVLRGIATPDVTAFQTEPEMNPRVAGFYAILANVLAGARYLNLIQVRALTHC